MSTHAWINVAIIAAGLVVWTAIFASTLRIGTRSLLFGVHCFFLHPWFVAAAWWKLYGFPWDPRLWVAFVVHDWGYWGKCDMDGSSGETHVILGANIMHRLFDRRRGYGCHACEMMWKNRVRCPRCGFPGTLLFRSTKWRDFCLYHSRFYAKRDGAKPSKLCFADKLSFCYTPKWLYIPMATLSGEICEYMMRARQRVQAGEPLISATTGQPIDKYSAGPNAGDGAPTIGDIDRYQHMRLRTRSKSQWFDDVSAYMRRYVAEHKDGAEDTWTPKVVHGERPEAPESTTGVYQ